MTITLYVKGDQAAGEQTAQNRGVVVKFQGTWTADGTSSVFTAPDNQIDNVYLWYQAYGHQSSLGPGAMVYYTWSSGGTY